MGKSIIFVIATGSLCVVTAAWLQGCGDSGLEDTAGLSKTGLSVRAHCGTGAGPDSGNGVTPTFEPGNPTCADLLGSSDFETEFKYQPVEDTDSNGLDIGDGCTLHIDVSNTNCGQVFEWSVSGNCVINAIFVKGGPNGNLFDYNPDGAIGDTGLHSPVNPNNNRFYGLSHISFCFSVRPPPECESAFNPDTDDCSETDQAEFCAKPAGDSLCTGAGCTVTLFDPSAGSTVFTGVANGEFKCIDAIEAGCYTATVMDAIGQVSENDCKRCAVITVGDALTCQ